ncbi:hypothetical protein LKM00_26415 [Bacillus wiedmannii]|nr:hypothetical protein [Bacillus wiedmannii]MCC2380934.1 hypothetical protein [Bacillus wiedmannii]
MLDPKLFTYKKENVRGLEQCDCKPGKFDVSKYITSYWFSCEESEDHITLLHRIEYQRYKDTHVFLHYFCPSVDLCDYEISFSQTMKFVFENFGDYIELNKSKFEKQILLEMNISEND